VLRDARRVFSSKVLIGRSSNLSATLTESGVSAAPRLENYFVN